MSYLEEALTYLDMGWCVYPAHSLNLESGLCTCGSLDCAGVGKHPVGRWFDYKTRRPTKHEVETWFGSLECNVGMLTGRVSGIAVIDVDGSEGLATLAKLNLEPTLTSRTGGGGRHLFYSSNEVVPTRVRILPGIDIRGEGGFIVLPPSNHKSGRVYQWLDPIVPLAQFDSEIFSKYKGSFPESTGRGWVDEVLGGVPEGERSTTAARLAGRYFNMGLSLYEVDILMNAWNDLNEPPLEESDLKRTINWTHRKYVSESAPVRIQTLGQIRDMLKGVI